MRIFTSGEQCQKQFYNGKPIYWVENGVRKKHPLVGRWEAMQHRCFNPKDKAYANYGGRGVTVAQEWQGLQGRINFFDWAYAKYPDLDAMFASGVKYELDRENNNENYGPENCRIVSKAINNRNKRNTVTVTWVDGIDYPLGDLYDLYACEGLGYTVVEYRLKSGWNVELALSTPPNKRKKGIANIYAGKPKAKKMVEYLGEQCILIDLVREFSLLSHTTVKTRINLGWDVERALTTPIPQNKNINSRKRRVGK